MAIASARATTACPACGREALAAVLLLPRGELAVYYGENRRYRSAITAKSRSR